MSCSLLNPHVLVVAESWNGQSTEEQDGTNGPQGEYLQARRTNLTCQTLRALHGLCFSEASVRLVV